jgi:Concanavalin A-like lectin/glucanases superfamily
VLAATLLVLGGGEAASAATLKANYQLRGTLASEVAGAPELTNLGSGNRFAFETIDGVRRSVLAFPEGNGLSLATTGLVDPNNYSVALVFRLAETSGYRRILDFSNGASDNGFYDFFGKAVIYGAGTRSQGIVFGDSYVQVVFTSAAAPGGEQRLVAYVNGTEVVSGTAAKDFDLAPGTLRFFQDNTSGPAGGEESAGAVACILVYDGALTAAEAAQVAADQFLCPAPRPVPGRAKALVTGKPEVRQSRNDSLAVDTGLTVSCPIGTKACAASGQVNVAPVRGGARAARLGRLGAVKLSVPAGASRNVVVRLSGFGARVLREAGTLRVKVTAEIATANGRKARARQTGRIEAPRSPAFKSGVYTGTTSQGLPIFVGVGRRSIQSVFFRWRVRCADGKVHTNVISLRGDRVRRGRFSFGADLDSGGSVHVSGRIRGVKASGTVSRTGASAFGTECAAQKIRWHARRSGVESEPSR